MRDWLRSVFLGDRRQKKLPVIVERRQRVTVTMASKRLDDSIERFAGSVDRLKAMRVASK